MDMDEAVRVAGGNRRVEYLREGKLYGALLPGEEGDPYGFILVPHGNETKYAHLETERIAVMDWWKNRRRKNDDK